MKRAFFAFLIAAAALIASCNNNNGPAPFKTNFDRKASHKFDTPVLPLR